MSDEPNQPENESNEPPMPDRRGERPTDPNELAKWIVEQTTDEQTDHEDHSIGKS